MAARKEGGLLLRVIEKFGSSRCGEWASMGGLIFTNSTELPRYQL